MTSLANIRKTFLNYFKENDHTIVQSSPLVPHNDPTLLFTNAGMVQFKDVFTGLEQRPYTRASTSQKCLRAGGKHNDLDNVGYTARHHTFFEMLGNFSFGNYFKEQAIYHAWNLITKDFAIDAKKLLVTIYADDDEAFQLWGKIAGLSDDKIIRIATADNFWSMGDTGPCGPCSEIFFDHGEQVAGGPPGSKEADGDRFVEIWNLVFMQFEQHPGGSRTVLPKPSIDTGMGLERIAAVLQGVHNNYDTDLFKSLINHSIELTKKGNPRQSHNVIADHLRASAFLIADGVFPSNEGRGYVLRRIMRRAMRQAYKLGSKEPLMHQLAPTLINLMGEAYPELIRAQDSITYTLKQEEERFRQTLERGLKILKDTPIIDNKLPGNVAFKLYDTYGFPLDLTQDILREEGKSVDLVGFNQEMATQKQKARANWAGSGELANEQVWYDLKEKFGQTEFLGYSTEQAEGIVLSLIEDSSKTYLLTNQTPFYAESGGQAGDQGSFIAQNNCQGLITDTQKKVGTLHVHFIKIVQGKLSVGDTLKLTVDSVLRQKTAANHSCTHLLHAALRKILGGHVTQKGSLVNSEKLRFDFVHNQALTKDQIKEVENLVNQKILANLPKETKLMSTKLAMESGAMALFGEKYGDEVRVVTFGDFSTELCGGTHVENTEQIGLFKIISESSVAAGIRRIEAITGFETIKIYEAEKDKEAKLIDEKKLSNTQTNILKKQQQEIEIQAALGSIRNGANVDIVGDYKIVTLHFNDFDPKELKVLVDRTKQEIKSGIVIVTSTIEDKVSLVIGVTNDLTNKFNAVKLVKIGAEILGGKGGGGRPDLAQTGGDNFKKLPEMLRIIKEHLS